MVGGEDDRDPGWDTITDEQAPLSSDAVTETGVDQPELAVEAQRPVHALVRGEDHSWVVDLHDEQELLIGRSPTAAIRIDSPRVSRRHALLCRRDALLTIEDLDSHNGTIVNGVKLRASKQHLVTGDVVSIGNAEIVIAIATRPRPPASSVDEVADLGIIAADPAMVEVVRTAVRYARFDTSILLLGETGVGKEVIADLIHHSSRRAQGPFKKLNCGAIPENLFESELFGHEKNAFTGANQAKTGYIEAAGSGTLLLDEIGDLPRQLQVKLLRMLENRTIQRLGSTRDIPVDVRVIAATHRDLDNQDARGEFRDDLYYRLAGFTLRIPPLRHRPHDIPLLAELFARDFARRNDAPAAHVTEDAISSLLAYRWPGNVRELRNVVERAVVHAEGDAVTARDLPPEVIRPTGGRTSRADSMRTEVEVIEMKRIEDTFKAEGYNQSRTARQLGISRGALLHKLKKYGIKPPR